MTDRPVLAKVLDYMRDGDALCVWKLDRFGQLVKEVLTLTDDLHDDRWAKWGTYVEKRRRP